MQEKVCVIPGDEAGPEVVMPTVDILKHMNLGLEFLWPPAGLAALEKYGDSFPQEAKKAVDEADCTLFGSVSHRSGPRRAGLTYLRWGKQTYANLRVIKYLKGMKSPMKKPEGIDFVIVRENLEGLYPGREGDITALAPLEVRGTGLTRDVLDTSVKGKYAIRIITEKNTKDICEVACQEALKRKVKGKKGKVTVAAKYTVLTQTDGLFRQIAEETVKKYPELTFQQLHIDNFAQQIVLNPQQFDVVVMPNEYGDVQGDAAAGLIGGLGVVPSACIGKDYAYFEPIHGSAPDIAGKNIINPTAMILSAAMMLSYLGFENEAARLEDAVRLVYDEGKHLTADMGGTANTLEFCEAVKSRV